MKKLGDEIKAMMGQQSNFNAKFADIMKQVMADEDVNAFLTQNQDQLADGAVSRGAAKLYEFYNDKQQVAKGEKTFAPGYFPQLVVNDHLIDISYTASPEVVAKNQQKALQQRIITIMMPNDIKQARLSNFDHNAERFNALDAALNFVDHVQEAEFEPGIYLSGPFGVGKTYLLGALANELAEKGIKTTLVHFPSFAVEMKAAIGNSKNTVAEQVDRIKKAPVLMLDDIGADSMSSWIRDDILGVILEYRMQQQLPTFFSSNFTMDQLANEHLRVNQRGDDEPLKAQRLMQRIRFLAREVPMEGYNRRQQN